MFEWLIGDRAFPQILRAFVVTLLFFFGVGAAIFIQRSYLQAREQGEATAQKGAAQVATFLSDVVADTGRWLTAMATVKSVATPDALNSGPPSEKMSGTAKDREFLLAVVVLDAQGRVVEETIKNALATIGITNREFFDIQRNPSSPFLRDRELITAAARDPSEGNSNLVVSRRLSRPDGSFAGVALIGLD